MPSSERSKLWYVHSIVLWDPLPSFRICNLVPKQYRVFSFESGWDNGSALSMAFLSVSFSLIFRGSMFLQEIFNFGGLSLCGFSKQPLFTPNASSLCSGYLRKLCLREKLTYIQKRQTIKRGSCILGFMTVIWSAFLHFIKNGWQ